MLRQTSTEDGVSPVVGVILMVAVTVILAAVIGSFVLDLGSNVQANPQAGVTFSQSTDSGGQGIVTVQVISMENADSVEIAAGSLDSGSAEPIDNSAVGDTIVLGNSSATDKDATLADDDSGTITVIGSLDGKESVIQTFDYDFN
jgi:flagellin-like protein